MKIEKDLSEIRAVYAQADAAGRSLMQKLYSKSVLGDVKDRITSFEAAVAELNRSLGKYAEQFRSMSTDEVAYIMLKVITEALNEGWTPDWNDEDQPKYFPWFDFRGSRFVFGHVYYSYTFSILGSRLCFRSEELAEYAGKTFTDLYNQFLN